jgi:hypothetical protein
LKSWAPVGVVLVLSLVAAGRAVSTYREFDVVTGDEGRHIAASVEVYQLPSHGACVHNPPLPRFLNGLLPYLAGVRLDPAHPDKWPWVVESSQNYYRTLVLARLGTLAFLPLLLAYTYLWGACVLGRSAGYLAALVVSLCPNIIAYSAIVSTDLAATATVMAATFHLYRWSEEPSWGRAAGAAVACGLALMTKFSAVAFLPPIVLAYLFLGKSRLPSPRRLFGQAALAVAVIGVLIWVLYGFPTRTITRAEDQPHEEIDRLVKPGSLAQRALYRVTEASFYPPLDFLNGLLELSRQGKKGQASYLLGGSKYGGWPHYYPVMIAVKATLPLLLLAVVGVVRPNRGLWYVAAAIVAMLVPSAFSTINIGVRHVLPVFPLLGVLAAAGFLRLWKRRRALAALAGLLLLWHGTESAAAHPDYLTYFNPIARGREDHFTVDANLDWGQDLGRLARFCRREQIGSLHYRCFGTTPPEFLGISAVLLRPEDRPQGWVAISQSYLHNLGVDEGLIPEPGYSWLRRETPRARIGKSILVYFLE